MKKRIFLVCLALVLLSGCAKTPDEVKANMRGYNANTSLPGDSNSEYSDAAGLFDGEEEVLNGTYQNLTMPKRISARPVKSIPVITFRQTDNFERYYKEIMSLFFDKVTLSRQNIIYDKAKHYNDISGYYFDNKSERIHAAVDASGSVTVFRKKSYDSIYQHKTYERVKIIHTDLREDTDVSFKLSGEDYSIKNAIQYVNDWIKRNWAKYEPKFTFRVKTLIVRKLGGGNYYYQIRVEKLLDGIPLDESGIMRTARDEKNSMPYFARTFNYIEIEMFEPNTISYFDNDLGNFTVESIDNSIKRYISLQGAARLVEKKLSGFKNIKISDIKLKYILCPKYDHIGKRDKSDSPNAYRTQSINAPGITITSRPVWAFIIDVDPDELKEKDGKIYQSDVYKYVYVDAITGKLELNMKYTPERK